MARLLGSARKFGLHPRLQAAYQLGVTLFVLFHGADHRRTSQL